LEAGTEEGRIGRSVHGESEKFSRERHMRAIARWHHAQKVHQESSHGPRWRKVAVGHLSRPSRRQSLGGATGSESPARRLFYSTVPKPKRIESCFSLCGHTVFLAPPGLDTMRTSARTGNTANKAKATTTPTPKGCVLAQRHGGEVSVSGMCGRYAVLLVQPPTSSSSVTIRPGRRLTASSYEARGHPVITDCATSSST
jgi:hypothetical protein